MGVGGRDAAAVGGRGGGRAARLPRPPRRLKATPVTPKGGGCGGCACLSRAPRERRTHGAAAERPRAPALTLDGASGCSGAQLWWCTGSDRPGHLIPHSPPTPRCGPVPRRVRQCVGHEVAFTSSWEAEDVVVGCGAWVAVTVGVGSAGVGQRTSLPPSQKYLKLTLPLAWFAGFFERRKVPRKI